MQDFFARKTKHFLICSRTNIALQYNLPNVKDLLMFHEKNLELYSSAITLSDMECFVFPELMYSLVLANIMSPAIWQWRNEDSFVKLEGKNPWRKLLRLRQYIMDEFDFNLDLQTWGMTTQQVELARFDKYISRDQIAQSNALFGYQGDKYYFDVDIRKHFGLDQYDGNTIPYWKTETVEAMKAFRRKPGYNTGAGECVSLSSLYAAAAFIVCGVPLEDIFMVLTPLHSQNFIDIQDGVISNNRRMVTKAMWFNGTEISIKAQRAIRNEQVTVVGHHTGWVHCLYDKATIEPRQYQRLQKKLSEFLTAQLNALNFANFLRANHSYQKHFQFCRVQRGKHMFVKAETLFGYEHGSRFRVAEETFEKLLDEVSSEDYLHYPHEGRICCEQLRAYLEYENVDIYNPADQHKVARFLAPFVPEAEKLITDLIDFLKITAKLPTEQKHYEKTEPLIISPDWSREQIIDYLKSMRDKSLTADLAFYAYRDMDSCDWRPFLKAAMERCPVSIEACKEKSDQQVYAWLHSMSNESIYDGNRLAQPDEVVNYTTGDGVEKALTLANILCARNPGKTIELDIAGQDAILADSDKQYRFISTKNFQKKLQLGRLL
jgi:hypothetical protein